MAVQHHDILENPDPLRRWVAGSLGLHAGIFGLMVAAAWVGPASVNPFGDPNSSGPGSVTITPVNRIPMHNRSDRINPVANDTESQVPATPKPREREQPEPDAIAIGKKNQKKQTSKKTLDLAKYYRQREKQEERPNQLYSRSGAAASTPMFGSSGGGGVGLGNSSPFGTRFGYYEQLVREKVGRTWRTNDVPGSVKTAPPVIVLFEIQRDGSVRDVRIGQSSGIGSLDYSCQRAILESSPFEPLPRGFERTSALIEFWFQLKR